MEQEQIQQLVRQSQGGNSQAFGQLVVVYQPFVFRIVFKLLCNTTEAEDITQEAFIRAWIHLPNFDGKVKFSTWLYRIAVNLCYDQLRQQKRRAPSISPQEQEQAIAGILTEENAETALTNEELIHIITLLTNELTPKQKLVFTLWDLEGIPPEEIRTMTGLSSAKIKSNLYLARKYIRKRIDKLQ